MIPTLHLVALEGMPIFQQLQLEEALLRTDAKNFCLINHRSPPAIVMGISGKADELVDFEEYQKCPLPIIRRFSGGGTVLIEPETLFLSFIFNRRDVDIGTCPKRLLLWTKELLQPAFGQINFQVQENDYTIGDKKIGGNAQYFTKDRWLHHTSFVWDYSSSQMQLLKMPPKTPEYRKSRSHDHFLERLKGHFASQEAFFSAITKELSTKFCIIKCEEQELAAVLQTAHRKATKIVLP